MSYWFEWISDGNNNNSNNNNNNTICIVLCKVHSQNVSLLTFNTLKRGFLTCESGRADIIIVISYGKWAMYHHNIAKENYIFFLS